jgi:predicted NAD/FAD-binding protein
MSCAQHLAEHPDKFDVTLIEAQDRCGGQAFSIPIDKTKHRASWLNQGVQGGSYIFHHTMTMFARQGYVANPVKLQVSFGKDDHFWSNMFPTKLLQRHQGEVKRFYRMLSIVRWFEVFFALLPIKLLLKLFWFSDEFANTVALPMVALFLGTGNYTPEVPSVILERLCTSPTYGMWYPPDKHSIASNIPPMVVFPNFKNFYSDWKESLEKHGVTVRLCTEVTEVLSRGNDGVKVRTRSHKTTENSSNRDTDENVHEAEEHFDELVLCVLADSAKQILAKSVSFRESRVLGSAKFADDITVTHCDTEYMKRHYENFYNQSQAVSSLSGTDHSKRLEYAKDNFKPMYMIKMYPQDFTKLEMCFDCTNYQAQFPPDVPFDQHVFQTIFLNNQRDSHLWTIDEIDETKIIRKDWWHQLCHSYTHCLFVVPWMWFLNGRRRTRFAGSWTMLNAHEVAVMSGIAAAVDLGASYPDDLERDKFALLSFRLYYLLTYGKWYQRKAARDGEGTKWATGLYGSVYNGPGVTDVERSMWKEEKEAGRSL